MRFWGFAALPKWRRRPRRARGRRRVGEPVSGLGAPASVRTMSRGPNTRKVRERLFDPSSGNPRFTGLFRLSCKLRCRISPASEGRPIVRTRVRLQANANDASGRRRRPDDRLRDPRRVRARARWENFAEQLRDPPSPPDPHSLLGAAAARRRSSLRPRLRPLLVLGTRVFQLVLLLDQLLLNTPVS
jgi:hypothetical protein